MFKGSLRIFLIDRWWWLNKDFFGFFFIPKLGEMIPIRLYNIFQTVAQAPMNLFSG